MKISVLSTSRIAEEFLDHLAEMPGIAPAVLCCRPESRAKAESWAARYAFSAVYTDEAAFFAADQSDAVYIATANHLHYDTARRALLAGRSVILEKPFTHTLAQAQELYRIADEKNLFLFEAITIPYLPGYRFLLEQLPGVGPVKSAYATFCAAGDRYAQYLAHRFNTTFSPECLGGALNDMNVYNLHLFQGLFGMPQASVYCPCVGYNGIDTSGLALLRYPEFTAACLGARDSRAENGFTVQGPRGYLALHGSPNSLEGELYSVVEGTRTDGPKNTRHRMAYEFLEFARILAENDRAAEAAARARTLAVMELLDTLHGAPL